MISPDLLISYAQNKGIKYLYDADGNNIIDTRDVDKIAQAQQISDIGENK